MTINGKRVEYLKDIEISFEDVIKALKLEALGIVNTSTNVSHYYISEGKVVERDYGHGSLYTEDVITNDADKVRKFELVCSLAKNWNKK